MLSRNSTNGRSQVRMKKEEGGSAYRLDYNNIIFFLGFRFINGKVYYGLPWIFFNLIFILGILYFCKGKRKTL